MKTDPAARERRLARAELLRILTTAKVVTR